MVEADGELGRFARREELGRGGEKGGGCLGHGAELDWDGVVFEDFVNCFNEGLCVEGRGGDREMNEHRGGRAVKGLVYWG